MVFGVKKCILKGNREKIKELKKEYKNRNGTHRRFLLLPDKKPNKYAKNMILEKYNKHLNKEHYDKIYIDNMDLYYYRIIVYTTLIETTEDGYRFSKILYDFDDAHLVDYQNELGCVRYNFTGTNKITNTKFKFTIERYPTNIPENTSEYKYIYMFYSDSLKEYIGSVSCVQRFQRIC